MQGIDKFPHRKQGGIAADCAIPQRRAFLVAAAATAAGVLFSPDKAWPQAAPKAELKAQRLAWAGMRFQLGKANLFVDPLVNPDIWGPALKNEMVPIDAGEGGRTVLLTHLHPDHNDPIAIQQALGTSGTLICASHTGAPRATEGVRVRMAALYEPVLVGDFTVTAVPAVDGYGDPQVSWVISGGGKRVIHCGDTLWHGSWWHIGRQLGPFDAAFLPINGARFGWREPVSDIPAVLTPEQAVAAAVVLNAKLVVPIHYGVEPSDAYREVSKPETLLIDAARRRGMPVEIVRPGSWLTWRGKA